MNYRLKAALAAVALTIIPGAVLAQGVSGKMMATDYDAGTAQVFGESVPGGNAEAVRHVAGTQNVFIGDPGIIPPGPCRSIAIKWNMGIFTNKTRRFFLRQIDLAATFNCHFAFVRDTQQNALGSYDLISLSPAQ